MSITLAYGPRSADTVVVPDDADIPLFMVPMGTAWRMLENALKSISPLDILRRGLIERSGLQLLVPIQVVDNDNLDVRFGNRITNYHSVPLLVPFVRPPKPRLYTDTLYLGFAGTHGRQIELVQVTVGFPHPPLPGTAASAVCLQDSISFWRTHSMIGTHYNIDHLSITDEPPPWYSPSE